MPLQADFSKYTLEFKQASGTSRGILREKESWFISISDSQNPSVTGLGECGLLRGLSYDDVPEYETVLQDVCDRVGEYDYWMNTGLVKFPSIRFGLEMAMLDLRKGGRKVFYDTAFTEGQTGIWINGLVWMGRKAFMLEQIKAKLKQGFRCIKLKIGAIDFDAEISLLRYIRSEFNVDDIEIRVDANGAFSTDTALEKLKFLSDLELHSIEQPIATKQWDEMAALCAKTPLDIALDEELIGIFDKLEKKKMLKYIQPQYAIFKPSLLGGFESTQEWIDCCESMNIRWWITSALESNIGLNAIAQFVASKDNLLPQGLGTGQLYTNNIPSPLFLKGEFLYFK